MEDFIKFLQGFFIVFPIVTFVHLMGHTFFVFLFGGKGIRIFIGCGDKLWGTRGLELRKFYFWYGGCEFKSLRVNHRISHSLIFIGGSLFNLISIFVVNKLVEVQVLEDSMLWYQFIYFSFYFIFFALFPMDLPDGYPSDGKAIYSIWSSKVKEVSSEDCHWRIE
ncbi:hypothetical protein LS684_03050 [Cytobacillus spongiae]|jgi:hypothetical protein|uniref:hypothetical protein n=1 Tax=Cytobacillus spongiae TaxID=2901381 RepID=UPI001F3DF30E|nr:hypothetical protein [Cytobacillus spongiae]UII57817.1 hypothetical protein LS684_03050 [Cytobacillus spongiae]